MRFVIALLLVLLLVLQYRFWFAEGGMIEVRHLSEQVEEQRQRNARLRERNRALSAEVRDLKKGLDAVESRARSELGMVREGETFFHVVEPQVPGTDGDRE